MRARRFDARWREGKRYAALCGMLALALWLSGCSVHSLLGGKSAAPTASPTPGLVKGAWAQQHFPGLPDGATPGQVAFAAADPATGYACVNDLPPVTIASATPDPRAATLAALFSTADSGKTWQALAIPPNAPAICDSSLLVAPDSVSSQDVFFLANATPLVSLTTVNGATPMRLFRSANGGQSWQNVPLPIPARMSAGFTLGWNPAHMTIRAHGARLLLGTTTLGVGSVVYASADNGLHWASATGPSVTGQVFVATGSGAHDALLALATGAGYGQVTSDAPLTLWSTADGLTWKPLATITPSDVTNPTTFAGVLLAASPDGKTLALLELGAVTPGQANPTLFARSLDGGATWGTLPALTLPDASAPTGTRPLGVATDALLGSDYSVTNDGKLWLMPTNSDDYLYTTKDKGQSSAYYSVPSLYFIDSAPNAAWTPIYHSDPGWQYVPQPFFTVCPLNNSYVMWAGFAASGVGATASGVYHFVFAPQP